MSFLRISEFFACIFLFLLSCFFYKNSKDLEFKRRVLEAYTFIFTSIFYSVLGNWYVPVARNIRCSTGQVMKYLFCHSIFSIVYQYIACCFDINIFNYSERRLCVFICIILDR